MLRCEGLLVRELVGRQGLLPRQHGQKFGGEKEREAETETGQRDKRRGTGGEDCPGEAAAPPGRAEGGRGQAEGLPRGGPPSPLPFNLFQDAPVRVIAGKTIAVKSSNFGKRQRPHGSCHEWIGVYQNDEVLVSEWTFKFPLRKSEKRKEPNFHEFLKSVSINSISNFLLEN